MKLNGESLKQFKDYSKKYNVIFDVEINSIKDALSKAKKFAHNYKIISANNLQKRNLSQIESINKRLQVLKIELSDFEKLNEKHTKNIREFNKEFKQYNKKNS